jgi:hypothetical protein
VKDVVFLSPPIRNTFCTTIDAIIFGPAGDA